MRAAFLHLLPLLMLSPALRGALPLTITLYDAAGLPDETREAMKEEASRILLQAGIPVTWIECEIGGRPANQSACAQPLGPSRFMLQLVPGRNSKTPRTSGMAVIQKGASVFACVYPERVRELARDSSWEFADLLGHAAAHEVGHLLLESSLHSNAGIMRARWETEDLRRLSHNGLVFLQGQLQAAQLLLASRE